MIPLNFYEKLTRLCTINKTSPSAVAKAVGLSNSSATYWKKGAIPKGSTLIKLATYFNVPIEYFLSDDEKQQLAQTVEMVLTAYPDRSEKDLYDWAKNELLTDKEIEERERAHDRTKAYMLKAFGAVPDEDLKESILNVFEGLNRFGRIIAYLRLMEMDDSGLYR